MKKLWVIAVVCSLILATSWAVLNVLKNNAEVSPNNSATLRTFSWALAGIDFSYPPNWTVLSGAPSSETTSQLELISSTDGIPEHQPYFCVDLSIDPASSDYYQLRGGSIVASAGSGLVIYQRFLDSGGLEELQAWLTDDRLSSVIPLASGRMLFAEVSYRCVAGDAEISTLSAGQQQSSSYYLQSLAIVQSVASGVRLVGD